MDEIVPKVQESIDQSALVAFLDVCLRLGVDMLGGKRKCPHCQNPEPVHERWCVRVNDKVKYAYEILMDPDSLLESDRSWLACLKTKWGANQ